MREIWRAGTFNTVCRTEFLQNIFYGAFVSRKSITGLPAKHYVIACINQGISAGETNINVHKDVTSQP